MQEFIEAQAWLGYVLITGVYVMGGFISATTYEWLAEERPNPRTSAIWFLAWLPLLVVISVCLVWYTGVTLAAGLYRSLRRGRR